jgi:hypothetical protein
MHAWYGVLTEEDISLGGAVLIVFHGVQFLGSNGGWMLLGWMHTIPWIPGGQLS